jgi:cell division protease FtsH
MQPYPMSPFPRLLIELAADLARGVCCLVVCDKGWTQSLFGTLRTHLKAMERTWDYLDGRHASEGSPLVWVQGEAARDDVGVVLTTVTALRRVVQARAGKRVIVLPHLDLLVPREAGMTNVSREVVPLLYEHPEAVFLAFQDPTLPLLPVVEKIFQRRYVLPAPYRQLAEYPIPEAVPIPVEAAALPLAPVEHGRPAD